jgi:hypothetical protein
LDVHDSSDSGGFYAFAVFPLAVDGVCTPVLSADILGAGLLPEPAG